MCLDMAGIELTSVRVRAWRVPRSPSTVCRIAGTRPTLFFVPVSGRRGLGLLRRLRRIELAVALFDAAGSFVPGDGDANMVGANAVACRGDFLLRLAVCQGKDLIAETRRGHPASS